MAKIGTWCCAKQTGEVHEQTRLFCWNSDALQETDQGEAKLKCAELANKAAIKELITLLLDAGGDGAEDAAFANHLFELIQRNLKKWVTDVDHRDDIRDPTKISDVEEVILRSVVREALREAIEEAPAALEPQLTHNKLLGRMVEEYKAAFETTRKQVATKTKEGMITAEAAVQEDAEKEGIIIQVTVVDGEASSDESENDEELP